MLDERQLSASPFAGKAAKDTAHAIIDQMSPKDVAAVAFMVRSDGAQEFTADRARLHAAIDTYSMGMYAPVSVLAQLRDVSRLLANIPERRKILVYIGAGQGFDPLVLGSLDKVTSTLNADPDPSMRDDQLNQFNYMMSFFSIAQRANINIYGIDPNGLDGGSQLSTNKEFLRLISNATGGRAITGNNAPASEITKILGENSSYYMLAFRSSNRNKDGTFRRLQVKVNRPQVDVRSRRGYVEGQAGPLGVANTNPALNRLIPSTQLALALWAAPAGRDKSGAHPVALIMDVELPRQPAPPVEHVSIQYAIVDMTGKVRASGKQDLSVSPPPGAGESASYIATASATADLPPGKYDIRLAALSVERNRRGGLIGDVVVPDYDKEGLSATGVFLGGATTRLARVAFGDPLGGFVSVAPVSDRVFTADAAMVAAFRMFQAKQPPAPVTIKVTIIDARDKVAFETTEKVDAAPFAADGHADFRFGLPLAKIGAGQFLLRFEAARPGAPPVKREVLFTVR
jgi:VWFA-related protein